MARRSSLPNLVVDAFEHEEATASNRNWRGTRMGNYVGVEHHGTHMFNVTRAGVVQPVDRGHGSMTDRCGVRRITAGFGCGGPEGIGYRELYDDEPMNRLGSDQWRHAIDRSTSTTPGLDRSDDRMGLSPIRATIGDPVPVGRRPARAGARRPDWVSGSSGLPGTHSGLAGDDFSYSDMNLRGPDYSYPDPFDFQDPEQARQAQSITDMEETIREDIERSSRPRNEGN